MPIYWQSACVHTISWICFCWAILPSPVRHAQVLMVFKWSWKSSHSCSWKSPYDWLMRLVSFLLWYLYRASSNKPQSRPYDCVQFLQIKKPATFYCSLSVIQLNMQYFTIHSMHSYMWPDFGKPTMYALPCMDFKKYRFEILKVV